MSVDGLRRAAHSMRAGIASPSPSTTQSMARHKSHQSPTDTEPALEIASLIDICFLLLIYFIVTSTIIPRESDLDLALPSEKPIDSASVIDPLHIRIEAGGEISTGLDAGRQTLDSDISLRELPLLRSHLEMIAAASRAAGTTPAVRIDADDRATQQRVIDVLNALAATGIHSVTFTDPFL